MQKKLIISATTAAMLISTPLLADQNPWRGSAEAGASLTTGNSDAASTNARLKLGYEKNRWDNRFRLDFFYAREDGEDTANRILGEFQSDYSLTERDYLFGVIRGISDEFSGYKYQTSLAGGYGRKLWVSDQGSLKVEAGPGVRNSKDNDDNTETDFIGRFAGELEYQISANAQFEQDVTVITGSDNTEVESITGISASLTDTLAMKLSYTVQHNTSVPTGTKKTDTFTSINLVYNFK